MVSTGTRPDMAAAGVPFRGENGNTWRLENSMDRMKSQDALKSFSVSPGNPMIQSDPIWMVGTSERAVSTIFRYSAQVYLRPIFFRILSEPA